MNVIIVITILLVKNLSMLIILLLLNKLRQILKLLNLRSVIDRRLQSIRIFLIKFIPKIGQKKYSWLILCWKLTIKYLNGETIIGSSNEKELLTSML